MNLQEEKMNICDLLIKIGFATSKGEAKRMVIGKGIKINSITETDISKTVEIKNGKVIQFGKNKFVKIVK